MIVLKTWLNVILDFGIDAFNLQMYHEC